jgi:hypothetical protein
VRSQLLSCCLCVFKSRFTAIHLLWLVWRVWSILWQGNDRPIDTVVLITSDFSTNVASSSCGQMTMHYWYIIGVSRCADNHWKMIVKIEVDSIASHQLISLELRHTFNWRFTNWRLEYEIMKQVCIHDLLPPFMQSKNRPRYRDCNHGFTLLEIQIIKLITCLLYYLKTDNHGSSKVRYNLGTVYKNNFWGYYFAFLRGRPQPTDSNHFWHNA